MHNFLQHAEELFSYTQTLRRDFHRYPELGFREIRTAGIVAKELESLGLEVTRGIGKTGVVGILEGAKPGPTILLRFDMDALPITEETEAEYASIIPGIMHACGHDGHTAIGLTVAKMLHAQRTQLAGTIKFCFQPSEEGFNGEEVGGAEMMMRDGVLDAPKVEKTLSLHLWNEKPLGWVHIATGPIMAGEDQFTIKLTGRGGHSALPHTAADPIMAVAQIVSALQTIVSRNVAPLQSAVVTVATIHAGAAFNVIPQDAELGGTIRTFDLSVRKMVLERFKQIVHRIAESMECKVEIELIRATPAVINNDAVTSNVLISARKILQETEIDTAPYLTLCSEDMAFMQERVNGCYFLIGSSNKDSHLDYSHHHPKFDFDERALVTASALMASAAADLLK